MPACVRACVLVQSIKFLRFSVTIYVTSYHLGKTLITGKILLENWRT